MRLLFLLMGWLVVGLPSLGQTNNPYHLNGSALQENCNCYTLTPDDFNKSGSVWNINKIDLRQSFEFKFEVYLGCRDTDGADGIVFVLQPISTSIGSTGGGLGYQGVTPSVGISIDTWQNTNDNDPFYDHLTIHKNGDINHNSPNNLAGPVMASNINIEDCQWHSFHITWNATTHQLSAEIDGKDRVEATVDMVNTIFNGDPMVFWGFTGSTGGSRNWQRFCTSLNPGIRSLDHVATCYPLPIQFIDSSRSFGSILKWYWSFGDGTTDTVAVPAPHVYPAPGIYEVKLNILGNNGCVSDTFRTSVTVGSEPIAGFAIQATQPCVDEFIGFYDTSRVQFGNINDRIWQINSDPPVHTGTTASYAQTLPAGNNNISLTVTTKEGCVSTPINKPMPVFDRPQVDATLQDACFKEPVSFLASSLQPATPAINWYWNLGDLTTSDQGSFEHIYNKGGIYTVKLAGQSAQGCWSDTVEKTIQIYATQAFAGRDTIVSPGQPVQLNATGGVLYNWAPATGLSDPTIANPVAIIQNNTSYILTAYAPIGCETKDTINIKVLKGPAIYVPNAFTPNGDGRNDVFRFIPVGMTRIDYFRIFNRYGQLVYSSTDPAKGWDGTINGTRQPNGTYIWMVSGLDYNGKPHVQKGTVVLVR